MAKMFFCIGADDLEMRMIEKLLTDTGLPFVYAQVSEKRCHPGNAYKADPVEVPAEHRLVIVECEPVNFADFPDALRIDHHRPGIDATADMGPGQYWEAASIGQLHRLLGKEPDRNATVMAAFDHCFPAAVRGECPDVSAGDVVLLKAVEIAKATNVTEVTVHEHIDRFRRLVGDGTPCVWINEQGVIDLRSHDLDVGYSLDYLSAQVAVAMSGKIALLRGRDTADGPDRITIYGNTTSRIVEAFMKDWAPARGLVGIYGAPARGYAGGYTS